MKLIGSRSTYQKKPKMKMSKRIVCLMLSFLLAFTIFMIFVYIRTGGIPDTLVQCVFTFCGAEAGVLGWIKYGDNKFNSTKTNEEDSPWNP